MNRKVARVLSVLAACACCGWLGVANAEEGAAIGKPGVLVEQSPQVEAVAPAAGCASNAQCNARSYCAKADGNCNGIGTCKKLPRACLDVWDPVCGCDGNTYSNSCYAALARVNVDYRGECVPGGEICGGIQGIPCSSPYDFCKLGIGECCCDFQGVCTPRPEVCLAVYDPVCGCDGLTYGNECEANAAGMNVDHYGPCGAQEGCTSNADCFRLAGPIYGVFCKKATGDCDGVGQCSPSPELCLDVWIPVCGCDGNTYSNTCYANRAGVNVAYEDACGW